jgi:regulatory protein YycH of two-component signal transduction system YycFG
MRYESIKSIILTVLVLTSIFLTWNLWTYQPKVDFIQNAKYIQDTSLIEEKNDIPNIVKPSLALFHKNGNHYGTNNESKLNSMIKELRTWNFDNFENISASVSKYEFLSFVHGNGNVEILFPEEIPMEIMKAVLHLKEKDLPFVSFDRLMIPVDDHAHAQGLVYFISYEQRTIYQVKVNQMSIDEFERAFYHDAEEFPNYFTYKTSDTRMIFLPEKEMVMNQLKYYPELKDPEQFKFALFTDPSYVKKDILYNGEVYTDGSRLLKIDAKNQMLQYVNPAAVNDGTRLTSSELVQKSIDFINDHGGWTDTYRLSYIDEDRQMTAFQLYVNNYPVFNSDGLSEIIQIWGSSQIYQYSRPVFSLNFSWPEQDSVKLPTGYEAIEKIKQQPNFQPSLLKNVVIGYELKKDPLQQRLLILEPIWCYLYGDNWMKVDFTEEKNHEIAREETGLGGK